MGFFEKLSFNNRNREDGTNKTKDKATSHTKFEQQVIKDLQNERQTIQEIGHELLESLQLNEGRAHLRQKAKKAQKLFFEAIAAYMENLGADDVERAYTQDPNLLFFLDLTQCVSKEETEHSAADSLKEVLSSERSSDYYTRARAAGAINAVNLHSLLEQGYEGEDLIRANTKALRTLAKEYLDTRAALRSLEQTSPETAHRLAKMIDLPLASFVSELHKLVQDPDLKIHLEQKDYQNPIFLGVREVINGSLHEKEERWHHCMSLTVSDPLAYSSVARKDIPRAEYAKEVFARMHDREAMRAWAVQEEEKAAKKLNNLQTYDLFLDELERYAEHGTAAIPPAAPSAERPLDEWDIGAVSAAELLPAIRNLVQSIPQKEAVTFTRLRRGVLNQELHTRIQNLETGNQLTVRFYRFFQKLLEETGNEWKSMYGRDRTQFLRRDLKEACAVQKELADQPVTTIENSLQAQLAEIYKENLDQARTFDDIWDIVDHPSLLKDLAHLSYALDLNDTVSTLTQHLERDLTATQALLYSTKQTVAEEMAHPNHDTYFTVFNEWLTNHPLNRWHPPTS